MSVTSPKGSAESRRTFYPPAGPDLSGTQELPGDNPESAHLGDTARPRDSRVDSPRTVVDRIKHDPIQGDGRSSPLLTTRERAPANTGRHEDPQTASNVKSRSREPQKGHPEVEESERPQQAPAPMPQADRTDNDNHAQNRPRQQKTAVDWKISSHHRRNSRCRRSNRSRDRRRQRRCHRRYEWHCGGLRVRSHDTSQQWHIRRVWRSR